MGNALSYKSLDGGERAVTVTPAPERTRCPRPRAERDRMRSVDGRRECARRRAIDSACVPSAEATRNARLFVG